MNTPLKILATTTLPASKGKPNRKVKVKVNNVYRNSKILRSWIEEYVPASHGPAFLFAPAIKHTRNCCLFT